MSAAAAALNKAEMGIETKSKFDQNKKLLSISSDDLYVGDEEKSEIYDNEAAAITMAKDAANKFAQQHPDT